MNIIQASAILKAISCGDYVFQINGDLDGPTYLQGAFKARNSVAGVEEVQRTRKWQLSRHMTESELVQTALKLVLTSEEHEARERFKYKGQAIFSPHFDVNDLVMVCKMSGAHAGARP